MEEHQTYHWSHHGSELIALYKTCSWVIWINNFTMGLKVIDSIKRPFQMYFDNEVVVTFSNNNKGVTPCIHLEIKESQF